MIKRLFIYFFFLSFFDLGAAIYSYRDASGNVIITDKPASDDYQILVTTSKQPRNLLTGKGFHELLQTGDQFLDIISYHAKKNEIAPALLTAIIKTESNFNHKAVSRKGAQGLMQLMPFLSREYKVKDPFDPEENIAAGSSYFAGLLSRFKDVEKALAAYNAGPTRVIQYNGIPPYTETKNFVRKVKWYFEYYQKNNQDLKTVGLDNYFKAGFLAFQKENLELACSSFSKASENHPSSPEINYNLALSYDMKGEYTQAMIYYLKALSLDPFLKEAYYNLAIIYEKIGLNFKAVSTWQKYMEFEISSDVSGEVKGYIRELIKLISQKSFTD